jgi:hypothetical protein
MAPSTQFLVCGGLSVVFLSCLLLLINQDRKERFHRPEDGHDHAERRELEWYWNSDRNKDVEKIPFERPLSECKSHPEGLSGRVLDNLNGIPKTDAPRAP